MAKKDDKNKINIQIELSSPDSNNVESVKNDITAGISKIQDLLDLKINFKEVKESFKIIKTSITELNNSVASFSKSFEAMGKIIVGSYETINTMFKKQNEVVKTSYSNQMKSFKDAQDKEVEELLKSLETKAGIKKQYTIRELSERAEAAKKLASIDYQYMKEYVSEQSKLINEQSKQYKGDEKKEFLKNEIAVMRDHVKAVRDIQEKSIIVEPDKFVGLEDDTRGEQLKILQEYYKSKIDIETTGNKTSREINEAAVKHFKEVSLTIYEDRLRAAEIDENLVNQLVSAREQELDKIIENETKKNTVRKESNLKSIKEDELYYKTVKFNNGNYLIQRQKLIEDFADKEYADDPIKKADFIKNANDQLLIEQKKFFEKQTKDKYDSDLKTINSEVKKYKKLAEINSEYIDTYKTALEEKNRIENSIKSSTIDREDSAILINQEIAEIENKHKKKIETEKKTQEEIKRLNIKTTEQLLKNTDYFKTAQSKAMIAHWKDLKKQELSILTSKEGLTKADVVNLEKAGKQEIEQELEAFKLKALKRVEIENKTIEQLKKLTLEKIKFDEKGRSQNLLSYELFIRKQIELEKSTVAKGIKTEKDNTKIEALKLEKEKTIELVNQLDAKEQQQRLNNEIISKKSREKVLQDLSIDNEEYLATYSDFIKQRRELEKQKLEIETGSVEEADYDKQTNLQIAKAEDAYNKTIELQQKANQKQIDNNIEKYKVLAKYDGAYLIDYKNAVDDKYANEIKVKKQSLLDLEKLENADIQALKERKNEIQTLKDLYLDVNEKLSEVVAKPELFTEEDINYVKTRYTNLIKELEDKNIKPIKIGVQTIKQEGLIGKTADLEYIDELKRKHEELGKILTSSFAIDDANTDKIREEYVRLAEELSFAQVKLTEVTKPIKIDVFDFDDESFNKEIREIDNTIQSTINKYNQEDNKIRLQFETKKEELKTDIDYLEAQQQKELNVFADFLNKKNKLHEDLRKKNLQSDLKSTEEALKYQHSFNEEERLLLISHWRKLKEDELRSKAKALPKEEQQVAIKTIGVKIDDELNKFKQISDAKIQIQIKELEQKRDLERQSTLTTKEGLNEALSSYAQHTEKIVNLRSELLIKPTKEQSLLTEEKEAIALRKYSDEIIAINKKLDNERIKQELEGLKSNKAHLEQKLKNAKEYDSKLVESYKNTQKEIIDLTLDKSGIKGQDASKIKETSNIKLEEQFIKYKAKLEKDALAESKKNLIEKLQFTEDLNSKEVESAREKFKKLREEELLKKIEPDVKDTELVEAKLSIQKQVDREIEELYSKSSNKRISINKQELNIIKGEKQEYYDRVKFLDENYEKERKENIKKYLNSLKLNNNERLILETKLYKELEDERNRFNNDTVHGIKRILAQLRGLLVAVGGFWALKNTLRNITKSGIEFYDTMATVRATTQATNDEFQSLINSARRLGEITRYTSNEVAELQAVFARLGFSTKEILNATEAVVQLATAIGENLSSAAEVAGSTLRGFGMETTETMRIVDTMALSFTSSALNLERFKESMKLVGPMAKAVNLSVEQTTAVLSKLADAGLHGSLAGTALRNVLSQIRNENSKLSKVLGGTAQNWDEFVALLRAANDRGREFKDQALSGMDMRIKAIVVSLAEQADTLDALAFSYENASGSAKKMADIKLDTLKGDLLLLKSAFEEFQLVTFDKTDGLLRGLTQSLTTFIKTFKEAFTFLFSSIAIGTFVKGIVFGVKTISNSLKDLVGSIVKTTKSITTNTVATNTNRAATIASARANHEQGISFANLGSTASGATVKIGLLSKSMLVFNAIMGKWLIIATIIGLVASAINYLRESQERKLKEDIKANQEMEESIRNEKVSLDSKKKLIDKYIELNKTIKEGESSNKELGNEYNRQKVLVKELTKIYPGFNDEIQQAIDLQKQLSNEISILNEKILSQQYTKIELQIKVDEKALEEEFKQVRDFIDGIAIADIGEAIGTSEMSSISSRRREIDKLRNKEYEKLQKDILIARQKVLESELISNDGKTRAVVYLDNLSSAMNDYRNNLNKVTEAQNAQTQITNLQTDRNQDNKKTILENIQSLQEMKRTIDSLQRSDEEGIVNLLDSDDLEAIDTIEKKINNFKKILESLNNYKLFIDFSLGRGFFSELESQITKSLEDIEIAKSTKFTLDLKEIYAKKREGDDYLEYYQKIMREVIGLNEDAYKKISKADSEFIKQRLITIQSYEIEATKFQNKRPENEKKSADIIKEIIEKQYKNFKGGVVELIDQDAADNQIKIVENLAKAIMKIKSGVSDSSSSLDNKEYERVKKDNEAMLYYLENTGKKLKEGTNEFTDAYYKQLEIKITREVREMQKLAGFTEEKLQEIIDWLLANQKKPKGSAEYLRQRMDEIAARANAFGKKEEQKEIAQMENFYKVKLELATKGTEEYNKITAKDKEFARKELKDNKAIAEEEIAYMIQSSKQKLNVLLSEQASIEKINKGKKQAGSLTYEDTFNKAQLDTNIKEQKKYIESMESVLKRDNTTEKAILFQRAVMYRKSEQEIFEITKKYQKLRLEEIQKLQNALIDNELQSQLSKIEEERQTAIKQKKLWADNNETEIKLIREQIARKQTLSKQDQQGKSDKEKQYSEEISLLNKQIEIIQKRETDAQLAIKLINEKALKDRLENIRKYYGSENELRKIALEKEIKDVFENNNKLSKMAIQQRLTKVTETIEDKEAIPGNEKITDPEILILKEEETRLKEQLNNKEYVLEEQSLAKLEELRLKARQDFLTDFEIWKETHQKKVDWLNKVVDLGAGILAKQYNLNSKHQKMMRELISKDKITLEDEDSVRKVGKILGLSKKEVDNLITSLKKLNKEGKSAKEQIVKDLVPKDPFTSMADNFKLAMQKINKASNELSFKDKMAAQIHATATLLGDFFNGVQEIFSQLNSLSEANMQAELNRIEAVKESRIKNADEQFEKGILSQSQYEQRKKEIEDKSAKEAKEARRQQQAWAISEAIINGAIAITNVWKTWPENPVVAAMLTALVAANTAAQVKLISSQKFAKGGFTGYSLGKRDETGEKVAGTVHEEEFVFHKKATRGNVKELYGLMSLLSKGIKLSDVIQPNIFKNFKMPSLPAMPRILYADGGAVNKYVNVGNDSSESNMLLATLINKIEILNSNLVNKNMSVHIQNSPLDAEVVYDLAIQGETKKGYIYDPSR